MKVGIVGTGYVGLVSGAFMAALGHDVICVDSDPRKIEMLHDGKVPIYEPGLPELIEENVKAGRLNFTTDTGAAVNASQIIFICVGTPSRSSGEADLKYVEAVAGDIAEVMTEYKVIVDKSTVPVETGERVRKTVKRVNKFDVPFDVVSNPEFLREGSAVYDCFNPDRIVVGAESPKAAEMMQELYQPILDKTGAPFILTDIKTAELIKHASNAFLATKISFINAVSVVCDRTGADVVKLAEGMGYDKRIGRAFLNAGIGYGGSCFPKDVDAFVHIANGLGYDFELLKSVRRINEEQSRLFIAKIKDVLWNLDGKRIGVLGLAFKPDTDDMRRAPAIGIINELQKEGASIKAFDPVAMEVARDYLTDIEYMDDAYAVVEGADCLLLLTDWAEFGELDFGRVKTLLRHPIIIDGRNMFEPEKMREMGFSYISVGRPAAE